MLSIGKRQRLGTDGSARGRPKSKSEIALRYEQHCRAVPSRQKKFSFLEKPLVLL